MLPLFESYFVDFLIVPSTILILHWLNLWILWNGFQYFKLCFSVFKLFQYIFFHYIEDQVYRFALIHGFSLEADLWIKYNVELIGYSIVPALAHLDFDLLVLGVVVGFLIVKFVGWTDWLDFICFEAQFIIILWCFPDFWWVRYAGCMYFGYFGWEYFLSY